MRVLLIHTPRQTTNTNQSTVWVGCGCEENLLVEGRENKEEKDFAFGRKTKSKSVCHDCELVCVCVWFCGGSRLGGNSYRK